MLSILNQAIEIKASEIEDTKTLQQPHLFSDSSVLAWPKMAFGSMCGIAVSFGSSPSTIVFSGKTKDFQINKVCWTNFSEARKWGTVNKESQYPNEHFLGEQSLFPFPTGKSIHRLIVCTQFAKVTVYEILYQVLHFPCLTEGENTEILLLQRRTGKNYTI